MRIFICKNLILSHTSKRICKKILPTPCTVCQKKKKNFDVFFLHIFSCFLAACRWLSILITPHNAAITHIYKNINMEFGIKKIPGRQKVCFKTWLGSSCWGLGLQALLTIILKWEIHMNVNKCWVKGILKLRTDIIQYFNFSQCEKQFGGFFP